VCLSSVCVCVKCLCRVLHIRRIKRTILSRFPLAKFVISLHAQAKTTCSRPGTGKMSARDSRLGEMVIVVLVAAAISLHCK